MAKVSILDISGRKVAECLNVTNNQSITDLDKLISGVYFLKIEEGKNQFTTKLIKRKPFDILTIQQLAKETLQII